MNNCFVIRHIRTGAYHTVIKEAKPAIISFSTLEQALTFSKLVNEVNKPKQTCKLPLFNKSVKDLFVTKQTTINTLSKTANLSCLDVLLLGEDYTYTLYPAKCIETLDNDEFRYYLENKFNYDQ